MDIALALFPPLHWWAGGADQGGMPSGLVYLFVTSCFITASLVFAYLVERPRG